MYLSFPVSTPGPQRVCRYLARLPFVHQSTNVLKLGCKRTGNRALRILFFLSASSMTLRACSKTCTMGFSANTCNPASSESVICGNRAACGVTIIPRPWYLRYHVTIIRKRRRLLFNGVKDLALIQVEIVLVCVTERDDLRVLHLRRLHFPVVPAHAAATNHPQSYGCIAAASLANELHPGKPSGDHARGR